METYRQELLKDGGSVVILDIVRNQIKGCPTRDTVVDTIIHSVNVSQVNYPQETTLFKVCQLLADIKKRPETIPETVTSHSKFCDHLASKLNLKSCNVRQMIKNHALIVPNRYAVRPYHRTLNIPIIPKTITIDIKDQMLLINPNIESAQIVLRIKEK